MSKSNKRVSNPWPPPLFDRAVALWRAGMTAEAIARDPEFLRLAAGRPMTRSGIQGMFSRAGIRRELADLPRSSPRRAAVHAKRRPFIPTPIPPPAEAPIPFVALEPYDCRWIVGHDGYLATFCPCRRRPEMSYCDAHTRMAVASKHEFVRAAE